MSNGKMKEVTKSLRVFEAWDGTNFLSREECCQYEDATDLERTKKILAIRLRDSRLEWRKHKRRVHGWEGTEKFTWEAGRRHAQAIRDFRKILKDGREKGVSWIGWLSYIGAAARCVLEWKRKEKEAVARLNEARRSIKWCQQRLREIEEGTYRKDFGEFAKELGFEHVK